MLATAADKRNAVQVYLAEKFEKELRIDPDELKTLDAGFKAQADETAAKVKALEAQRPPEPKIQALWDRGEPSPTYIYRRGDPLSPGRLVGPGVPSVLTDGKTPFEVTPPWPGAKTTGRRLAFARWLTRPDHPLTARVVVNRLWKHHFGAGIVDDPRQLRQGRGAAHPSRAARLAGARVRRAGLEPEGDAPADDDVGHLPAGSAVTPDLEALDPENALYSRMPLTRLDAEALYDTLLLVAGRLDERRFGPPDPVEVRADGLVTPVGTERGLAAQHLRAADAQAGGHPARGLRLAADEPELLRAARLDRRPAGAAPDEQRHGPDPGRGLRPPRERARRGTTRPGRSSGPRWIAFGRPPSDEEKAVGLAALARLTDGWRSQPAGAAKPGRGRPGRSTALTTYCHAILNSAGFLYVD